MRQVQTRDVKKTKPAAIDDWQATALSFTTVRPLKSTPLAVAGSSSTLASGLKVKGHSGFRANARLATVGLSTRDLGGMALPRILLDDPTLSQPLTLGSTRGLDPGVSVLELTDIAGAETVTSSDPLLLTVPVPLAKNEHVLPLGFDGEFFLPLGRVVQRSADSIELAIDRLPPPLVDSRSLGGAIKIFFQKMVGKVIGIDSGYPLLAVAELAPEGTVKAITDPGEIARRVAGAKKIALFVHGIIAETSTMVPALQVAKLPDGKPLSGLYDLILTYDYENLGTTIEENGRLLGERLKAAGLGSGHDKALDVVAHSMGGLVSRWFIEQAGGEKVVRRLIMLGTPNAGSPWPSAVDWGITALSLGLNNLTAFPWSTSVVSQLTGLIENPTTALNEMVAGSKVLQTLAASRDPAVPYIMLAGNTSIIPAALAPADQAKPGLFSRLIAKVTSPSFLHEVADPFFRMQENDVAVSVASMRGIASGRNPAYDVRVVPCDHLSYFRDAEGLKALAKVLAEI